MKLSLVVLTEGKSEGKVIPITLSQFLIGRDPQCQLRPASALISKRHCAVLVRAGKVFVRDFDSTNGTFVNDEPVKGERELHHDDRLKVGPLLFAVRLEATAPTAPGKPAPAAAPAKASVQSDDDSIAAMWLAVGDDEGAPKGGLSESGVPEGSTVMEVLAPKSPEEGEQPGKDTSPPPKKAESTSTAAKAILEKYMRRPRG